MLVIPLDRVVGMQYIQIDYSLLGFQIQLQL